MLSMKSIIFPAVLTLSLSLCGCDSNSLEYDPAKEDKADITAKEPSPDKKAESSASPTKTEPPASAEKAEPKKTPERAETPAPMPQEVQACVVVNGRNIPTARLTNILIEDYGLVLAQQLIADEVVRQELKKQSLPYAVTPQQRNEQTLRTLERIFTFKKRPTESQLDNLLEQFLAKNKNTRRQWNMAMDRNVRLRRLAEKDLKITDEELKKAYNIRYDAKYVCRHIQTPDLQTAQKAMNELKKGKSFAEVAKKYSTNPSGKKEQGGLLPAIGATSNPHGVSEAIVKVARAMEKEGEVSSPVRVGTNFHILYLDEILPAENHPFDKVKEQLRALVRADKLMQLQTVILGELIKKANIEYVHPVLKTQHKQVVRESRLEQ